MEIFVPVQISLPPKLYSTDFALHSFLPGVHDSLVLLQGCLLREGFVTDPALVRPLSRVDQLVILQSLLVVETLGAESTVESLSNFVLDVFM